MLVRRVLVVAFAFTLLTAAPAAAQTYSDVLGTGQTRNPTVSATSNGGVTGFNGATGSGLNASGASGASSSDTRGNLARTGTSTAGMLSAAATALIGSGLLLVVVARRRSPKAPLAA